MVSVIVPVYNTEQYLEECIRTIVKQTYKDLEIIIINDGSTDSSGSICRKWEKLDKRIRYMEKENEGQGIARNAGIRIARGEYIIFVDSDDWIEPDLVEKVYAQISKWKADLCVYSHRHVGERTRELPLAGKTKQATNVRKNQEILGLMSPILCDKMFSTELIRSSDFVMSNRMCEDLVFNAQLYAKANAICFLDTPFYNYRYTREGNLSTNYKKYREAEKSVDELNKIFSQDGKFETFWIPLYELSFFIFKNLLSRIKNGVELHLPAGAENSYDELMKTYKKCLYRWFSHHIDHRLQEKSCLMLGSYNLRIIIRSLRLNEELLGEDYAYRKRCVRQDIEKKFHYHARFRDQDYLVMDLLDEIFDVIKIKEDCYITESEFLKELGWKELENSRRISLCSEERRQLFTKYAALFAEKVRLQKLPVIKSQHVL